MKGLSFLIYLAVILAVIIGATMLTGQYLFPPEANITEPTYTLEETLSLAQEHVEKISQYAIYQACSEEMDPSISLDAVRENIRAAAEEKLNGLTFSGFLLNSRFVDFPQYSVALSTTPTKITLTATGGPLTYTENGVEGTAPSDSSFTAELETGCTGLHPKARQLNLTLQPFIENAAKTKMRDFPLKPVKRTINRDDIGFNWIPYQTCELVMKAEEGKTYVQIGDAIEAAVRTRLASVLPGMGYRQYSTVLEGNVTVKSYDRTNIPNNYADVTCLFGYSMTTRATINVTEDRVDYQLFDGTSTVTLPPLTSQLKTETYHNSDGMVDLALLSVSGFYDVELTSDIPEEYFESWDLNLQRLEDNLTATFTRGSKTMSGTGRMLNDTDFLIGPFNTSFGTEDYNAWYLYLKGVMGFYGKSFSGTFNGTINTTAWTFLNGTFTATKTS